MAVASFLGGFLYTINPRMPFLFSAITRLLAFFLAFKLTEPYIDTEKFSLKVYLKQTKLGFSQLFKGKNNRSWIVKLLLLSSFAFILMEVLDPALAIDYGFSEKGLGFLYAVIPLISALGNHFYPRIKRKVKENILWGFMIILSFITVFFSPLYGVLLGGLTLLFRNIYYPFIDIIISKSINKTVESRYRATTLSTFAMLKNTPYVLFAYFIGRSIDNYMASQVAKWLVIIYFFLGICIYTYSYFSYRLKTYT